MDRYSFPSDTNVFANAFGKGKADSPFHQLGCRPFGFGLVFLLAFLSMALLDETAKKPNQP